MSSIDPATVTTRNAALAAQHVGWLLRSLLPANTLVVAITSDGRRFSGPADEADLQTLRMGIINGGIVTVLAKRGSGMSAIAHNHRGEWLLADLGWTCRVCEAPVPLGRRAFCERHGKAAVKVYDRACVEAQGDGSANARYHHHINAATQMSEWRRAKNMAASE